MKKIAKLQFCSNIESKIENYSAKKVSNNGLEEFYSAKKVSNNGLEEFCFTDEYKANCLNGYFVSISNLDDSQKVTHHLLI